MDKLDNEKDINHIIPEDTINAMEDRHILKENIRDVIRFAENQGDKLMKHELHQCSV